MSEILDAAGTVLAIRDLTDKAENFVYFISPYIKLDDALKEIFEFSELRVTVIFGKSSDIETLLFDSEVKIMYCENLHAKIYLSEKSAIVSSMNLYDYSYKNNLEISVLFHRDTHPVEWDQIYQQVKVIKKASVREW